MQTGFTLLNFVLNVGVFIHFSTTWLQFSRDNKEQTAEDIARARERNAYKSRQATIDRADINKLFSELKSVSKVAKAMNICRNSVYRNLEKVAWYEREIWTIDTN